MSVGWSEILKDIDIYLDKYLRFLSAGEEKLGSSALASHKAMIRSYNSFLSARVLCLSGLYVDSYNSMRTGLESGWLALILRKNEQRAEEWFLGCAPGVDSRDMEKRYRRTFGSVEWIRRSVSADGLSRRNNIYQALCVYSHANVASTLFLGSTEGGGTDLCWYSPGAFQSEIHREKTLQGIRYCLGSLLGEVDLQCGTEMGGGWKHDDVEVFNIAGVGYPDGNGGIMVDAGKINAAFQAMILLRGWRNFPES